MPIEAEDGRDNMPIDFGLAEELCMSLSLLSFDLYLVQSLFSVGWPHVCYIITAIVSVRFAIVFMLEIWPDLLPRFLFVFAFSLI